jgi:hypothetical protein
VLLSDTRCLPHPVGTESEDIITGSPGYLILAPADNDWSEERIPEEWRDARGRLKQTWRERVPQALWVAPDGDYAAQPRQGSVKPPSALPGLLTHDGTGRGHRGPGPSAFAQRAAYASELRAAAAVPGGRGSPASSSPTACLPSALIETYESRSCNISVYLECSHNRPKPESERPGVLLSRMARE